MFMHTFKTTFLTSVRVWMQGFWGPLHCLAVDPVVCRILQRIEIWGVWRLGQCLKLCWRDVSAIWEVQEYFLD